MQVCMPSLWDPQLIIYQIVFIQFGFYFILGVTLLLFDVFFAYPPSLNQIFSVSALSANSSIETVNLLSVVIAGLFGSFVMLHIVTKAKKVLDFSVTRLIFHFIICCIYSDSFPKNWQWWLTNIIATALETLLGEFLCLRREHNDISKLETAVVHV
eukprot:TRINITY_DN8092_c0_g1_i1.p1 TRINITY_DN8092_c0_g1~~TRINITY_DN8092_c0_g1_i1.p1  ORF type:complete len:156 (+),score=10.82 TRINITY_DN8092_c0_g1_i1:45-512(+)